MVAPRSFARPSVLSSSVCIDLQLKTHTDAPSFNMSPTPNQQTAPLRTLAHLATICSTSRVDAAAFASAH
eukprot:5209996-Pleurochrysis_carterae.AAC.1